jgi:hypothetical protein
LKWIMSDSTKRTSQTRRQARLQAALRENLKRRKAQARSRMRNAGEARAPGVREVDSPREENIAEEQS